MLDNSIDIHYVVHRSALRLGWYDIKVGTNLYHTGDKSEI